ncbi:serine hydrolase domain-containing protein [Deinococcus roseus]|uniref:Beta-lactamase-related domain-containing protein n=1 Tax=Deinococcus roseus TaxID=392414 RepID=A0ABQ2CUI0_9DEIO|nr:serine hydrolase [Deinococcus roseus]GGJ22071.1 hypothetical protein GCM10008938_05470 [Deinococcus roseus]
MSELLRSTPESQGLASQAISAFLSRLQQDQLETHSFMLLRHGQVIAEGWWAPYQSDLQHQMYSVSKSFTSTAIGFAVQEGILSVNDTLVSFFPEDLPEKPGDNLKAMTLKDLLTMTCGHDQEPWSDQKDWMKFALSWPVPHVPGTHFLYNSIGTYMVGAAVQKATGQTLVEYLTPRLFEPLGFATPRWEMGPEGWNMAGWGLFLRTEELAKWGQMMLQKGQWAGQQLLSESWIEEASSDHTGLGEDLNSDWNQGYGYQMWRCRHGAYRADGAFGQFCVILPEQDAVVVLTSGESKRTDLILQAIWDELLPHFQTEALHEDAVAHQALLEQLQHLQLPSPEGQAQTSHPELLQTYQFADNKLGLKSIKLVQQGADHLLNWADGSGNHQVLVGASAWVNSESKLFQNVVWPLFPQTDQPWPVAARGAWTDETTFALRVCLLETPFAPTITLKFSGDGVSVGLRGAIHFGPTERPEVVGHRVLETAEA